MQKIVTIPLKASHFKEGYYLSNTFCACAQAIADYFKLPLGSVGVGGWNATIGGFDHKINGSKGYDIEDYTYHNRCAEVLGFNDEHVGEISLTIPYGSKLYDHGNG
jgi:hypothetical protein